jgi:hypothetical protein
MSALPPKADVAEHDRHVRFVPKTDIAYCGENSAFTTQERTRGVS